MHVMFVASDGTFLTVIDGTPRSHLRHLPADRSVDARAACPLGGGLLILSHPCAPSLPAEATTGSRSKVVTVEGMDPKEAEEFLKTTAELWKDLRKQEQLKLLAQRAGDRFDLLRELSAPVAACEDTASASAGAWTPPPRAHADPARPARIPLALRGSWPTMPSGLC